MTAPEPAPARPVRHAISLLVHEQVPVIVDQCRNFETFARAAVVMVHVSPSASFSRKDLADALAAAGCTRSFVNPVSVSTQWGQIVEAHFANIEALAPWCDAHTTLTFHASNDMLLAELPPMGTPGLALYQQREVSPQSVWSSGRTYATAPGFADLLAGLDCRLAMGSQVEGSSFPYALMADLAARMRANPRLVALLPPIAEELVFATFAANHLGPPTGHPYVMFRPNRIGAFSSLVVPRRWRRTGLARLFNKAVSRVGRAVNPVNAVPADVQAIIAGKRLRLACWPFGMPRLGPAIYHGIKRVERRFDDPLRQIIRAHTQAVIAAREAR